MHAVRVEARQIADHPEIPAWIHPDPSAGETSFPQHLLAGRLQIAHDRQKDMLPEPLFRTHRYPGRLRLWCSFNALPRWLTNLNGIKPQMSHCIDST